MWIATAEHSKHIDRRASEEYGVPAKVLMERAGLAVFDAVKDLLPHGGRITVFCGKGNNGGDGFVVARLAVDHHFAVDCLVACEEENLSPEAHEQMRIASARGVQPIFYSDGRWRRKAEALGCRDLIVDALLGTGARCEVKDSIKESICMINRSGVPVLAVDVPSGICANTGEELGESVWALRTVTFGLPKQFLFEGIGLEHAGYWTVSDIGIPNALLNEPTHARLIDEDWVANMLPERLRASHKGDNGSVLIVAGSRNMRGAATLAAKAAIRSGAGLVTVAGIPDVLAALAINVPEAIMLPLPEVDGVISPEGVDLLLRNQNKYHSALFGPGLTHNEPVCDFLGQLWPSWEVPSVIDADALNAISHGVAMPDFECVLTPHPGEMSRLLKCSTAEIQADRFRTAAQAVEELKKCSLLKGPYSIVSEPGQPMMVNITGNPGLASAGMGDVLSGVIATLLGQDLDPYTAASCGMYWHGTSGDLCATEIGPIGFSASDVADTLAKARCRIVSACQRKLSS